MDIKIVSADGTPKEVTEVPVEPSVAPLEGTIPGEMEQREVGRVLGVENESEFNKYQPNFKTLVEYAKTQTEDHTAQSLKWVIRDLEARVGTAPFAEDRIKFITRYAWLLLSEQNIKKELKKFEKI